MANWIELGSVEDFPTGEHVCTEVNGQPVVVFNLDGNFYAIENVCPHAGLPLGEGERHGNVLVCPFHGYAYNVKTGKNADFPEDEVPCKTFDIAAENGKVQIKLDK